MRLCVYTVLKALCADLAPEYHLAADIQQTAFRRTMETNSQRSSSVKRLLSQNLKNVDSQFLKLLDGGKAAAQKNLWFFEIAWEVANQGSLFHQISNQQGRPE